MRARFEASCPACGRTLMTVEKMIGSDLRGAEAWARAWEKEAREDSHRFECADAACMARAGLELDAANRAAVFGDGGRHRGSIPFPIRVRDRTTPMLDEVIVTVDGELKVRGRHLTGCTVHVFETTGGGTQVLETRPPVQPRSAPQAVPYVDPLRIEAGDLDEATLELPPRASPPVVRELIVVISNAHGRRDGGRSSARVVDHPGLESDLVFAGLAHHSPGLCARIVAGRREVVPSAES